MGSLIHLYTTIMPIIFIKKKKKFMHIIQRENHNWFTNQL